MTGMELPVLIPLLGKASGIVFSFYSSCTRKKELKIIHNEIYKLKEELSEKFQKIDEKLSAISDWFVDELRSDTLRIYYSVIDSLFSNNESARNIALTEVYSISSRMITVNKNSQLMRNNSTVNEINSIISCGYWGRFCFFLLQNELIQAKRQVYSCAVAYPQIAFLLFPNELFDDHPQLLSQIDFEIQKRISDTSDKNFSIEILNCSAFPSNLQLPLLEIQYEEELERLQEFSRKKLRELIYE